MNLKFYLNLAEVFRRTMAHDDHLGLTGMVWTLVGVTSGNPALDIIRLNCWYAIPENQGMANDFIRTITTTDIYGE